MIEKALPNHAIRRRRVCIVGPFPPRGGGVTVQTALLARYLRRENVDVLEVDTTLAGLRTPALKWLRWAIQPLSVFLKLLAHVPRCDVVQLQSCSYRGFLPALAGVPVARLFGKRSVVFYMGGLGPEFIARYARLVTSILRMATVCAACSDDIKRAFEARGVACERLENIYDSDTFAYRDTTTVGPRLIWTRCFEEPYDPMMAVHAFQQVKTRYPDATLVMTSDGGLKPEVERYVAEQGIRNVQFLGRLPVEALAQAVRDACIYINTSRVDGVPTALLEASGVGLPIITTPVGGIPTVYRDGHSAIMVQPGDYRAMAGAIIDLLNSPEECRRLAKAAREVAVRHTWEHQWPALQRFYGFSEGGSK